MELLQQAISRLSPIHRTLVTLYHLDELGIGEIATVTGLPEGTVKNYLFRARARLRATLETKLGVAA
jgi:RNA polymerase sigma-70 factor (ECF subfamily)